jgi:hypothetical protein
MTQCEYRDLTGGQCRASGKACIVARINLPSRTVALCKKHAVMMAHTVTDRTIDRIPVVRKAQGRDRSQYAVQEHAVARAQFARGRATRL